MRQSRVTEIYVTVDHPGNHSLSFNKLGMFHEVEFHILSFLRDCATVCRLSLEVRYPYRT